MQTQIVVIALIKAENGKEQQLKDLAFSMIEPTRAEAGCLQYILHQDAQDKTSFMFYEVWQSQQALEQHMKTDHLQNLIKKSKSLLAEPIDVKIYKNISQ